MPIISSTLCDYLKILEAAKPNRNKAGLRKHRIDQRSITEIELEQLF